MRYRPVRDKKGQMRKVFCGCNDDWTPLTSLEDKAKEEGLILVDFTVDAVNIHCSECQLFPWYYVNKEEEPIDISDLMGVEFTHITGPAVVHAADFHIGLTATDLHDSSYIVFCIVYRKGRDAKYRRELRRVAKAIRSDNWSDYNAHLSKREAFSFAEYYGGVPATNCPFHE